jgi:hypothetical protein
MFSMATQELDSVQAPILTKIKSGTRRRLAPLQRPKAARVHQHFPFIALGHSRSGHSYTATVSVKTSAFLFKMKAYVKKVVSE